MFSFRTISIMLTITLVFGFIFASTQNRNEKTNDTEEETTSPLPSVNIISATNFSTEKSLSLIGTVVANNEALITSQTGGKIQNVNVKDGDYVNAGAVLIQLENSQQRASLQQAEAGLQQALTTISSAQTSSLSSQISIEDAETNLANAKKRVINTTASVITAVKRIILNNIDPFYSRPKQGIPGVRIGVGGEVQSLNEKRVLLRTLIPEWEHTTNPQKSTIDDYIDLIQVSIENINTVKLHLELLDSTLSNKNNNLSFTNKTVDALRLELSQKISEVTTMSSNLEDVRASLRSSKNALNQARTAKTDTQNEQALAQVAQAEAVLAGAQASLEQTILRAPISGEITDLDATIGGTVGAGTPIARIIGDGALEIELFVSPRERQNISTGNKVRIRGVGTGFISRISPSIDSVTQKQRVIVATDSRNLVVGNSVRVEIVAESSTQQHESPKILLPITAVQFSNQDATVLIVDEDQILQSVPVQISRIRNSNVEIVGGIDLDTQVVSDARGLRPGTKVEINNL